MQTGFLALAAYNSQMKKLLYAGHTLHFLKKSFLGHTIGVTKYGHIMAIFCHLLSGHVQIW